jgi:hypothetical protein
MVSLLHHLRFYYDISIFFSSNKQTPLGMIFFISPGELDFSLDLHLYFSEQILWGGYLSFPAVYSG